MATLTRSRKVNQEGEPMQTLQLGELHTEGVKLRNRGEKFKPWKKEGLDAWYAEVDDWKKRVFDVLVTLSAAKAQRIQTLNRIPTDGVYRFWMAANKKHRIYLRTTERRLEILEEILGDYIGMMP